MSAEDYLDNYLCENLEPFSEKITKSDIISILDDGNVEYFYEDLDDFLDLALNIQKEIDEYAKDDLMRTFYYDLEDFLDKSEYEELTDDDIARALIKLSNSLLNGDYIC